MISKKKNECCERESAVLPGRLICKDNVEKRFISTKHKDKLLKSSFRKTQQTEISEIVRSGEFRGCFETVSRTKVEKCDWKGAIDVNLSARADWRILLDCLSFHK